MTDEDRQRLESLGVDEFYEQFSREMNAIMAKILKQIDEDAEVDFQKESRA